MSKYLRHVDRSVRRLGYLKPEVAPQLAALMDEYEGHHPHQIARKFRQTGEPLSREAKKAIGLRTNADMTTEAVASLTDKGVTSPIKGIEVSLLDASFAYFRQRSMQSFTGTESNSEATFHIRRAWPDCPGCLRLHDQEIQPDQLNTLPPSDCANEACALGIRPHIDFIGRIEHKNDKAKPEEAFKKSWLRRIFGR